MSCRAAASGGGECEQSSASHTQQATKPTTSSVANSTGTSALTRAVLARAAAAQLLNEAGGVQELQPITSTATSLQGPDTSCSSFSAEGRQIRLHCVTFNMADRTPQALPDALLGANKSDVDMYVIATQVRCVGTALHHCPTTTHVLGVTMLLESQLATHAA